MTIEAIAEPQKLPFWRTVGQAYALWARNFPDLVRACWLWLLLMAPIVAVEAWWRAPYFAALVQAARTGRLVADPAPWVTLMADVLWRITNLPALASIAVAWHRLLLRNEHPSSGLYLRRDSIVVGYAVLAFWIGVILSAPNQAGKLFNLPAAAGTSIWSAVAFFVLPLVPAIFLPRLSLVLPAIALGRNDVTLRSAWKASKGNTWRMFFAYTLCLLPPTTITNLAFQSLPPDPSATTVVLFWVASQLFWLPTTMIAIGMLSLAYRHFFERSA